MKEFKFYVDHAKSGRATCRGCRTTIKKNALRLGIEPVLPEKKDPSFLAYTQWYHANPACLRHFRKSHDWWKEHLASIEHCSDGEELEDAAKSGLSEILAELQEPQEECENEDVTKEKGNESSPAKRPRRSARTKKEEIKSESASSAGENVSLLSGSDEEAQSKPKRRKRTAGVSHVGKVEDTYQADALDEATVEQINANILELQKATLAQLKAMLKRNEQKMSGTKQEIVERVAESKVLGRCPNCELCGAHLRWNRTTGEYRCSGKYEDGVFIRCTFKSSAVERLPWKDR